MNWMTYLSVKAKMGLVIALFAVVVAIFANIVFTEWGKQERFSQKELYGTEFYKPSFDFWIVTILECKSTYRNCCPIKPRIFQLYQ